MRPDTNGMDEFTLAVAVNDMQAVHKCPRIYRPLFGNAERLPELAARKTRLGQVPEAM